MKCPKCEYNQKYAMGMVCNQCGYRFVLDPKSPPKMGDARMAAMIRRASAHDTRYFTINMAYMAAVDRHISVGPTILKVFLALLAIMVVAAFFLPALTVVVFVLLVPCIVIWSTLRNPPKYEDFYRAFKSYTQANPTDRVILAPGLEREPPPAPHGDVYDYGVEAVLIVERPILVDVLVRNNWHLENKTLVISESGYPNYLMGRAQTVLAENPDLPVYLMHDATDHGVGMLDRIQALGRLPIGNRKVVDLGLFPEDARKMKRFKYVGRRNNHAVPADMMGYGMMAGGITAGLMGGFAFADLLEKKNQAAQATSMSFG